MTKEVIATLKTIQTEARKLRNLTEDENLDFRRAPHHETGVNGMTIIFTPTPKACDICGNLLGVEMFDAKTSNGQWGCLCPGCFQTENGRLGTGYGQRYLRRTDGLFEKVEG